MINRAGEAKNGREGEPDLRLVTTIANENNNAKVTFGASGDGSANWCVGAFTCASEHMAG